MVLRKIRSIRKLEKRESEKEGRYFLSKLFKLLKTRSGFTKISFSAPVFSGRKSSKSPLLFSRRGWGVVKMPGFSKV
jgi:hypothetical protein